MSARSCPKAALPSWQLARASGEERALKAAEQAISNQLLDITIDGARGILFNVTGGPNLTLIEVNQAAAIIKETAHPDVNLIFGAVIDPNMGDDLRITVIATGFDRGTTIRPSSKSSAVNRNEEVGSASIRSAQESSAVSAASRSAQDFQAVTVDLNELEVPTFIRDHLRQQQQNNQK